MWLGAWAFDHLSRLWGGTTMVKGRNRQNDMLFDLVFALVSFLSGGGFAVSVVGCMGF